MVGKPEEAALEHVHDVVDDIGPGKTPVGDRQHSFGDRHDRTMFSTAYNDPESGITTGSGPRPPTPGTGR